MSGLGAATSALPKQFRFFEESIPELKDCFLGTLNVQLQNILIIENPDFYFSNIIWTQDFTEDFCFLRTNIKIPRIGIELSGFIYVAYRSPHRMNPFFHEIICPYVDDIKTDEIIILHTLKSVRTINYSPPLYIV